MSADFFTRLIAAQSVGPNMHRGRGEPNGERPSKVYVCGGCDAEHDTYSSAEDCCRPEVYTEYKCPSCDDPWGEIQDAEACCEGSVAGQPMQCPICLKGAESFEDAADCCLHVHPTMTALGRQRVAQAVDGGIPWPDAVAANIHH